MDRKKLLYRLIGETYLANNRAAPDAKNLKYTAGIWANELPSEITPERLEAAFKLWRSRFSKIPSMAEIRQTDLEIRKDEAPPKKSIAYSPFEDFEGERVYFRMVNSIKPVGASLNEKYGLSNPPDDFERSRFAQYIENQLSKMSEKDPLYWMYKRFSVDYGPEAWRYFGSFLATFAPT